jgi:hypothetical protein
MSFLRPVWMDVSLSAIFGLLLSFLKRNFETFAGLVCDKYIVLGLVH